MLLFEACFFMLDRGDALSFFFVLAPDRLCTRREVLNFWALVGEPDFDRRCVDLLTLSPDLDPDTGVRTPISLQ